MSQTTATFGEGRKVRKGVIVSDKVSQTRTVEITRLVQDPMYKKFVHQHKRVHIHDEGNQSHMGDVVEIQETRPLSKTKRWKLLRVLTKGRTE